MSEKEYREFGRPYDQRILEALPDDWWLNVAHLHGNAPMFDVVCNYPIQVLNWHDRETVPDLAAGKLKFPKAVSGGIGRMGPDAHRNSRRSARAGPTSHRADQRTTFYLIDRLRNHDHNSHIKYTCGA